ncbi:hypothetical protein DVH24_042496 [Malus domestica]|uniref:DNA2/NAM7 helicase helicase domain-containing protein n=1 Tax=Malus domestica TaxID=3750 RepID=A0A498JGC8_MALDO|nr:hypothetical protein DVH24_042496 [Malus domestica]
MGSRGRLLFDLNEPPAEDNEESDGALSFQPQKALPSSNPHTSEVLAVAAVAPRIVNNHAFSHASSVSGFQPFVRPKNAHGFEGDADEKSRDSNPKYTSVSKSSNDEDMKPVPCLASASANGPSVEREEGEWSDDAEGSAEAGGTGSLHEQGTSLQGQSGGIVECASGVAPDISSCDIKTSEGLKDKNTSHTSLGVDDQNSTSSRISDSNVKGQAAMDGQDEHGLVLKQEKVKGIEASHALKCANNPMKRKLSQQNEAKLGKKRNRQTMFLNLDDVKQAGTIKSSTPRRQTFPSPVTTRTLKDVRTITLPADCVGEKQSQSMIKDQKQVDVLCNDGGTAAESSDSKSETNGDISYGSLSRTRRQNGDNDPSTEVLPPIPRQSSWKQPTDTRQLKNSHVANRKPALITQSSMDSKSGNKKLLPAKKQTAISNTYQDTSVERLIREVTNEKFWHHPGETDLQCVPEKFESVEEYVRVFEPLLFEECRAQLYSTWEELTEGVSRDAHITVRVRSIERRERGWYDVIVLPVSECKWTFKEGDVAVLSTPRPGSVRSKRNNSSAEGDEEPEISGRVAGTVRRHIPIDTRDPPGAILHFYVGDSYDSSSLVDDDHVLRKLQPKGIWYLTVLGSLATTQREYIALHAFRRLNMQMQAAILRPSPEHFPKYEQQSPAMPECFTPNFIDHLHRTFNGPQLSAIQWAAMHTAAGTSGGKRQDPWPFTLVQGPPGTGKTHTVWGMLNVIHLVQYQQYYTSLLKKLAPESYKQNSETNFDNVATGSIDEVLQNMDQNLLRTLPKLCPKPRMLVCAPSNAATDELLSRVLDRGFIDGEMKVYRPDVARVGVDSQTRAAQAVSVERRTEQLLVKNREEVLGWMHQLRNREAQLSVMGNASALMQCDDWAALITDAKARNCFMDIETLPKEFRVPKVPSYAPLPGKPSSNIRGFRSGGPRHRSMDMHMESRSGTPSEDDEKLGVSVISRNGSYRPMKPPYENSLDDFDQSGDKSRDAWQYGIQKKHGPAGEFGSKGDLAGAVVGLCIKLLLPTIHHLTIFRVTEIQRGKLLDDSKALFAEAYSPTPPFLAPVASRGIPTWDVFLT